jgi:N-acetylmuramoyl-L-alanine amidase
VVLASVFSAIQFMPLYNQSINCCREIIMKIWFLIVASFLCVNPAFANETTTYLDQALSEEIAKAPRQSGLPPEEIFRRTGIVLNSMGVPAEINFQPELDGLSYTTASSQIALLLNALDPTRQAARFFDIGDGALASYRDRDSRKLPEYRFGNKSEASPAKKLSMLGLRIAIDPGHMGGDIWDKRTGKYAQTASGATLSEGVINLQTSLLMEQKLKALGAEVLVTHRNLGPVSKVPYDQMNLQEHAKIELRSRSLEDWFQALLEGTNETKLESVFKNSSAVKKIFSEQARSDYYAKREDLLARADVISAFKPDLTIIVHFDADNLAPTARMPDITRAYVPGSYSKSEFAGGEARARFLSHLGQGSQWNESVRLSEHIVDQISKSLNVPKLKTDMTGTTPISPGVFARNLALTRQINESPISYLECLSYGNDAEFARLSKKDGGTLTIDGKEMPYSKRLDDLASAIVRGISSYVDTSGSADATAAQLF